MKVITHADGRETVTFFSLHGTLLSLTREIDGEILLRIYRDGTPAEEVESRDPDDTYLDRHTKADIYVDVPDFLAALNQIGKVLD